MSVVVPLSEERFDEFYAVYRRAFSRPFDTPWMAIEKRVNLADDVYRRTIALCVLDDGAVVAGGTAVLPQRDNTAFAYVEAFTDPAHRRRGHGSAALRALLDAARAAGRTTAFAEPWWGIGEDADAGRAFAAAHGFDLDCVDAVRVLDLPAELPALRVAHGYTLHSWRGPCPDVWLAEYADLRRILVEEAPSGDAGLENEFWDAGRVRKDEEDVRRAGRVMQVTVALHEASGTLAGHTQLAFPADGVEVYQWDTLVRREHRGHGLGLALKIRTMHAAADLLAGRRRISTVNAAANAHMIAVNEALGFRQVAWAGEYVRALTPP